MRPNRNAIYSIHRFVPLSVLISRRTLDPIAAGTKCCSSMRFKSLRLCTVYFSFSCSIVRYVMIFVTFRYCPIFCLFFTLSSCFILLLFLYKKHRLSILMRVEEMKLGIRADTKDFCSSNTTQKLLLKEIIDKI